jgi:hypothetical protein
MNIQEYLQLMSNEYFNICKNQSIIEIGPESSAIHTNLIIAHNPKYLTIIEANHQVVDNLKNLEGINKLIADDVIHVLHEKNPADVVVCCGVLYHLHSPLHLLELITNNCNPKYIILDCVIDQKNLQCLPEIDNIPGNRYTTREWKSAKFNLVIPFEVINSSMQNMGYKLIKKNVTQLTDYSSKNNVWVAMWEFDD